MAGPTSREPAEEASPAAQQPEQSHQQQVAYQQSRHPQQAAEAPANALKPIASLDLGRLPSIPGMPSLPQLTSNARGSAWLLQAATALQNAQAEQPYLSAASQSRQPPPAPNQPVSAALQWAQAQQRRQVMAAAGQVGSGVQPQPRYQAGSAAPSLSHLALPGGVAQQGTQQPRILRPPLPMPAGLALGVKRKLTKKMASILKNFPPNQKRTRAKKPKDAPKRPKSAYMFFLGEFREDFKKSHPEVTKVAPMAEACGVAWRALPPERRAHYDALSAESKAEYAKLIAEYEKEHPKPPRRQMQRDPNEIRRPQSAYFCFLADFREKYKMEHDGKAIQVKVIGAEAGKAWKALSAEEKQPWEAQSRVMKEEFQRRTAEAEAAAMDQNIAGDMPAEGSGQDQDWSGEGMQEGVHPEDDDQDQAWMEHEAQEPEQEYASDGEAGEVDQQHEGLQHTDEQPYNTTHSQGPDAYEPQEHRHLAPVPTHFSSAGSLQSQHAAGQLIASRGECTAGHVSASAPNVAGVISYQVPIGEQGHLIRHPSVSTPHASHAPRVAYGATGHSSAQASASYSHVSDVQVPHPPLTVSHEDQQQRGICDAESHSRVDSMPLSHRRVPLPVSFSFEAGPTAHAHAYGNSARPVQHVKLSRQYQAGASLAGMDPNAGQEGDQVGVSLPLSGDMPMERAPSLSHGRHLLHFPTLLSNNRDPMVSLPSSSQGISPVVSFSGSGQNGYHIPSGSSGEDQQLTLPILPSLPGLPSLPADGWTQPGQQSWHRQAGRGTHASHKEEDEEAPTLPRL